MARSNTKERLIYAAMELFYANGYEATSVSEILKKADAGSGSLYYFFRDKEDLALAVAEEYLEMLYEVLFKPVYQTVDDPIERVFTVLDNYRKNLVDSNFTYGCPIGNLALEVSETLPGVTAVLSKNFDGWIEQVRLCLEDAKEQFRDDVDLHGLATIVLTTMEGGVMLSRTKKNVEPYDTAVKQLRSIFDSYLRK